MRAHSLSLSRSFRFSLFLCVPLLLPPGRSFWPSFSQLNSAADAFHVTRTRARTGAGPTPSEIHELATHTHTRILMLLAVHRCVLAWLYTVDPISSLSFPQLFWFLFRLLFRFLFLFAFASTFASDFRLCAAATGVCWVWGCLCLRGPRAKMESENRQPKTERAKPKPKTCYLYSARRCWYR